MNVSGDEPGRIGRTMAGSEPWWPPQPTAPAGAPNVIIMITDDVGYSDLGCFGGEIDTPNIDRLAAEGRQLTNFHVNPMCSPTRASLLTGCNAHAVGMGHVAQDDPGYPGYRSELADDALTAAEIFRHNGYATMMVGKWHLCRDSDVSAAGPQHSWPCQRGFDRFYGVLDAFTNVHHPHRLIRDNSAIETDRYPDGYYLTDDLTTQSISMIRERKAANPRQPFFLYFAQAAAHAPLMCKPETMERYRDRYHEGWDVLRQRRYERQLELGVIAPGTTLPPRNTEPGDDVVPWDELSDERKELFARYMAVYAAMIDEVDQSLGTLRAALEEMGEWDNTIVMFCSDNGASREGEITGTTSYYQHLRYQNSTDPDTIDDDLPRIELIGTPQAMVHCPRGWAMTSNTPFRLYKRNTHAGGHQVPCIWSWPAGLAAADDGTRRGQYGHVVDVLPTLLELTGISSPGVRHGAPAMAPDGRSFAAALHSASAAEHRDEQYYELAGHKGLYKDGWVAVTRHVKMTPFGDHEWELYDLRNDPTEAHDLAAERPDKVRELADAWEAAAAANKVYPLDEGSAWRYVVRPPGLEVFAEPVTLWPGTPTMERWRSSRLIWQRSFSITIAVTVAAGDRGTLVAHGDQGGGYTITVDGGRLEFVHNDGWGAIRRLDGGALSDGAHEIALDIGAPGGRVWNVSMSVDGLAVGEPIDVPMLFPMAPFEGIDVGIDRRSPVDWQRYQRDGPFPFTGRLHHVRYTPGELAPDAGERWIDFLRQAGAKFE